jgi:glutathione S-transferase
MKLYYSPFSTNSRRVTTVAAHLDIPLELVTVDLVHGEQKRPEFLAINPNGKVPALVDEGAVIWESNAIVHHLIAKTPAQTLWPKDARAQADVMRWQFWNASHLEQATNTFIWENVFKNVLGAGAPDAGKLADANAQWDRYAGVLDRHLDGRRYIAGDGSTLTLADIAIAASVVHYPRSGLPVAKLTRLLRWFEDFAQLPAWQKTAPPAAH